MDGTRTRDHSDHNRELYQLSYHRRRRPPYATTAPGRQAFLSQKIAGPPCLEQGRRRDSILPLNKALRLVNAQFFGLTIKK